MQKAILENEHVSIKNQISRIIPNIDSKVLGEFYKSFNGIALDITDNEAAALKKSNFVDGVFKNYKVTTQL